MIYLGILMNYRPYRILNYFKLIEKIDKTQFEFSSNQGNIIAQLVVSTVSPLLPNHFRFFLGYVKKHHKSQDRWRWVCRVCLGTPNIWLFT